MKYVSKAFSLLYILQFSMSFISNVAVSLEKMERNSVSSLLSLFLDKK